MRPLFCMLCLLLSWHDSVNGQETPRNQSEHDGVVAVQTKRADINLDFGRLREYEATQDVNDTKFRQESMPYAKAEDKNCSCDKKMSNLQSDLMAETNERLALKAIVENFVSEMHNLQKMVYSNSSRLGTAPTSIPSAERAFVAFSAKLSYNRELKPLDTVVFDTVLTNTGSPYNAETGMFTSPLSGTYMFQATILSGYNTKVETAIIVNDKEVARIYSGAHDAHGSGSNMAIVDLRSGDTVWVRLLYQGGSHVHGYYSTFSGTLLHEEE